jgi:hypothetical protein
MHKNKKLKNKLHYSLKGSFIKENKKFHVMCTSTKYSGLINGINIFSHEPEICTFATNRDLLEKTLFTTTVYIPVNRATSLRAIFA